MIRKLLAAGALMLAAMCLTVPTAYADGIVLDEPVTIDVLAPVDFDLVAVANCANGPAWVAVTTDDGIKAERLPPCSARVADLPGSGDGDDEPIASACHISVTADPVRFALRIDDVGWCST